MFKSAFSARTEIQFTCRRSLSQQSKLQKLATARRIFCLQASSGLRYKCTAGDYCKMRMGNPVGRAAAAEFQIPGRTANAARSQKSGPRLKTAAVASLQSRRCLPAAASCSFFLHAISLSMRFMPRTAIVAVDADVEEFPPAPPRRDGGCAAFPAHVDEVIE